MAKGKPYGITGDDEAKVMRMRPLAGSNKVIVKLGMSSSTSKSEVLFTPETHRVKTDIGKVLRVAEGVTSVAEGDYVLLAPYNMRPVLQSENMYDFFNERNRFVLVEEAEILAKIDLEKEKAQGEANG